MLVGRVGRPHGLDGSFYVVDGADGAAARARRRVVGRGARARSSRRAGTDEKPILRLEGSSLARRRARRCAAPELTSRATTSTLDEDEYWAHDLEGCAVVDGDVAVGFVRRMSALPSVEVLEVDRPTASELLVPMVRDCDPLDRPRGAPDRHRPGLPR